MKFIQTNIYLTEEDLIELGMSDFDPCANMYGPKKMKEPYEILQDIAEKKGLPKIDDMYGLTTENEIVCRNIKENRKLLENLLKK